MLKIKIDKGLDGKVIEYSKNIFSSRKSTGKNRFQFPRENLEQLIAILNTNSIKYEKHIKYVENIKMKYPEILRAKPSEIDSLILEFNSFLSNPDLSIKLPDDKLFYEVIVEAMRYDAVRDKEYLLFFGDLGIKACVYCNAQLAVNIISSDGKKNIAKFELDHFHPKSDYPFLCTSFYNLYPVCGNCNRAKSYNRVQFELYSEKDEDLNMFNFTINEGALTNYLIDYDIKKLLKEENLTFEAMKGFEELLKVHKETFDIEGIYRTQMDIVEELLHKSRVYTNTYNKTLVDSFIALFPDKGLMKRIVIGNYDKADEIHKRPMAKFTQDIAKQLGLI